MATGPSASQPNLWRRWLLAHLGAFAVAAVAGSLVELAFEPDLLQPGQHLRVIGAEAAPVGMLAGAGLAGLAQGWALRRDLPGWWKACILGTIAGLALAALAAYLLPYGRASSLPGGAGLPGHVRVLMLWLLSFALPLGVAQWLALRARFERAQEWLIGSLLAWMTSAPLGWLLSLFVGVPAAMLTSLLFSVAGAEAAGGAIGGLVLVVVAIVATGLIAGLGTAWMLSRVLR